MRNRLKAETACHLLVVLCLCMVLSVLSAPAWADTTSDGYTYEPNSSVAYKINGTTIDVKGVKDSKSIKTTYGDDGYVMKSEGLVGAVISADASIINGGHYVKLSYTVTNPTASTIEGKLGVYADVQIGKDDYATISVIRNSSGRPIGLRMLEEKDSSRYPVVNGAQFNLYFAGTGGVTDANTYWFGQYQGRETHCFDQLSESTKVETGHRADSAYYKNNLTEYHDGDSGLAISWVVSVPAHESRTYSFIVGVGEAAAPPEWNPIDPVTLTMSAEATKADLKLNVAARVKDADGVVDTLYYSVNDGTGAKLGNTVTGDGSTEKEITGIIDLTGLPDGIYVYRFWIVNSKGAASEAVERRITIKDGSVTGDVTITPPSPPELPEELPDELPEEPSEKLPEDLPEQVRDLPKTGDHSRPGLWLMLMALAAAALAAARRKTA